jgi:hypothetical protein
LEAIAAAVTPLLAGARVIELVVERAALVAS